MHTAALFRTAQSQMRATGPAGDERTDHSSSGVSVGSHEKWAVETRKTGKEGRLERCHAVWFQLCGSEEGKMVETGGGQWWWVRQRARGRRDGMPVVDMGRVTFAAAQRLSTQTEPCCELTGDR